MRQSASVRVRMCVRPDDADTAGILNVLAREPQTAWEAALILSRQILTSGELHTSASSYLISSSSRPQGREDRYQRRPVVAHGAGARSGEIKVQHPSGHIGSAGGSEGIRGEAQSSLHGAMTGIDGVHYACMS